MQSIFYLARCLNLFHPTSWSINSENLGTGIRCLGTAELPSWGLDLIHILFERLCSRGEVTWSALSGRNDGSLLQKDPLSPKKCIWYVCHSWFWLFRCAGKIGYEYIFLSSEMDAGCSQSFIHPALYILLKIPQELPDRIGSQASLSPKRRGENERKQ